MKIRLTSALPPGVLRERLAALAEPMTMTGKYRRDARLCAWKGGRFTLLQNGPAARIRPFRVFRGRLLAEGSGAVIEGGFGLSGADWVLCGVPSALAALMAVLASLRMALPQKLVFYGAAVLAGGVLIGFTAFISRYVGQDNEKKLLSFLEHNIAGGIDPEPEELLHEHP